MSRHGLPSSFDAWLTTDPDADRDEAAICRHCSEAMEYVTEHDPDGVSGSWVCHNKQCPATVGLDEYVARIEAWAGARRIIPNATPESQALKAVEEMGELANALLTGNMNALADAIGDVVVCLVNLSALNDMSLVNCVAGAWDQIKDRTGTLLPNGCFVKEEVKA